MQSKTGLLVGVFHDRDNAEKAYDQLREKGYDEQEINVLMSSETRERHFKKTDGHADSEMGNKAAEGVGIGSAIGGTLGAIVGAVAAIGTNLLLPGLGLVVAGPFAAAFAGAGAGGLTGGIVGALVGAGIPEEKAKIYNEALKNGRILISVAPHSVEEGREITENWKNLKAEDVSA